MDKKQIAKLEKLFYYVLALRPDEFGLVLDRDGYITVKELVRAIQEEPGWAFVRPAHVQEIVTFQAPERFETSADRNRVRAKASAGADGSWQLKQTQLPKVLFMAVRRRAYPHMLEKGLEPPPGSEFLVAAASEEAALRIGKRKDPEPVPIRIETAKLGPGHEPALSCNDTLFLLRRLPADAITGPPLPKQREERPVKKKKEKNPFADMTVAEILSPTAPAPKERDGRKSKHSWKQERRLKKKDGWL